MDEPQLTNPPHETDEERRVRLAHEAALIAEAEVDFAAGRLVPAEAVSAWLESLGRHLSDELALERVRTCRFTNARFATLIALAGG